MAGRRSSPTRRRCRKASTRWLIAATRSCAASKPPIRESSCPDPATDLSFSRAPLRHPGGGVAVVVGLNAEAHPLHQQVARHRPGRAAGAADLHFLLLAGRPGALLGLHARAALG